MFKNHPLVTFAPYTPCAHESCCLLLQYYCFIFETATKQLQMKLFRVKICDEFFLIEKRILLNPLLFSILSINLYYNRLSSVFNCHFLGQHSPL